MWGYYNKFESMKSLGVCYWCVKIPQCGYMGDGLKLITFPVQKLVAALEKCHNPPLVHDKPLIVPTSVKLIYCCGRFKTSEPYDVMTLMWCWMRMLDGDAEGGTEVPFIKNLSIMIQIQWQSPSFFKLVRRVFAHVTTAVLSWHVQNFAAIWYLGIELEQMLFL